jgi:hypothetical protein
MPVMPVAYGLVLSPDQDWLLNPNGIVPLYIWIQLKINADLADPKEGIEVCGIFHKKNSNKILRFCDVKTGQNYSLREMICNQLMPVPRFLFEGGGDTWFIQYCLLPDFSE